MPPSSKIILHQLISHAPHRWLDEDGRPLGEQSEPDLYEAAGVDERPCPFQDSRQRSGKPINMAALRQARSCMAESDAMIAAWCAAISPAPGALTAARVWRVILAMQCKPVLDKLAAPDAPISRVDAALFKVTLGFSGVLPPILLSQPGIKDAPMREVLTPDEFFELLDQNEWLTGSRQVCAGSSEAIKRAYGAMLESTGMSNPGAHNMNAIASLAAKAQAALVCAASFARASRAQPTDSVCAHIYADRRLRLANLSAALPGLLPAHAQRLLPDEDWPKQLVESSALDPDDARSIARADELLADLFDQLSAELSALLDIDYVPIKNAHDLRSLLEGA